MCSVIRGELESFRNYKGFRIIFPKILDAIYRFTKYENFSDSYLNHIFESEDFRSPINIIWGVKCGKLSFRYLLDKFRKL